MSQELDQIDKTILWHLDHAMKDVPVEERIAILREATRRHRLRNDEAHLARERVIGNLMTTMYRFELDASSARVMRALRITARAIRDQMTKATDK